MAARFQTAGALFVVLLLAAQASAQMPPTPNLAVFNFHMKSGPPDWAWLEKGLADMITSDLVRRRFPVVARDEMQIVAQEMQWAPEMVEADPAKLGEIKKRLKIHYIVTGVYEVTGNAITLTGQIVDVDSRTEIARKVVDGDASAVLDLQRELSAQLMGFFTGDSPERALAQMLPWTHSVPAARALYDGMHLFDQGRYADAWLSFRQASRADPAYVDAMYWTARMYYFLNRYDHARRAYEKFIYQDGAHPRVGDALQEYVSTYEELNAPADTLLALYARLKALYPDARIHEMGSFTNGMPARQWLDLRAAQLIGELGDHRQAIEVVSDPADGPSNLKYCIGYGNAVSLNMLTGVTLLPDFLKGPSGFQTIQFAPGQTQIITAVDRPAYKYIWFYLLAPSGYIFKSLHFYPDAVGAGGRLGMHVHKDDYNDVPCQSRELSLDDARTKGFVFDPVPRCGLFQFHIWVTNDQKLADPSVTVPRLRVDATFEKLGPTGALDVRCEDTQQFWVDVDGVIGRRGSGLIGLLRPGKHTLRFFSKATFQSADGQSRPLFKDWTTTVDINVGQIAHVTGRLPAADDSPWKQWTVSLVGRDYPNFSPIRNDIRPAPSLELDGQAIRVLWGFGGDVWSSVSTDGTAFSTPLKLVMPISSGWSEEKPVCVRDESGRFVLMFISSRDASHVQRLYSCWSRDFVHWSAPEMVMDRGLNGFDLMQDDQGRFILADVAEEQITLSTSDDFYHWKPLSTIALPAVGYGLKMLQGRDGEYDLMSTMQGKRIPPDQHNSPICRYIGIYRSNDAEHWSSRQHLDALRADGGWSVAMLKPAGRLQLVYFSSDNRRDPLQIQGQFEGDDGAWTLCKYLPGIGSTDASVKYSPRWGYVMTWASRSGSQFPTPAEGPFVMRGPNLDGLFGQPMVKPPATEP